MSDRHHAHPVHSAGALPDNAARTIRRGQPGRIAVLLVSLVVLLFAMPGESFAAISDWPGYRQLNDGIQTTVYIIRRNPYFALALLGLLWAFIRFGKIRFF